MRSLALCVSLISSTAFTCTYLEPNLFELSTKANAVVIARADAFRNGSVDLHVKETWVGTPNEKLTTSFFAGMRECSGRDQYVAQRDVIAFLQLDENGAWQTMETRDFANDEVLATLQRAVKHARELRGRTGAEVMWATRAFAEPVTRRDAARVFSPRVEPMLWLFRSQSKAVVLPARVTAALEDAFV